MSELTDLEKQLKDKKVLVENLRLAERLYANRDFRKLILEEFCVNEAARYVQVSGDPAMGPHERADALALAQASGHIKRWLSVQCQMGYVAEREIQEIEQMVSELRSEDQEA